MAVSGDAPTRAKFVSVLTNRLEKEYNIGGTRLVAEPDWGLSDYINACQSFPQSTAGALVVQVGEISNISTSLFLISKSNKTQVHASLLYSQCIDHTDVSTVATTARNGGSIVTTVQSGHTAKTSTGSNQSQNTTETTDNFVALATPSPRPYYMFTWQSDVEQATGKPVRFWTPLTALGFFLSLASGYTAVAPQRTITSVSSRAFPTPLPFTTLPPQGVISSESVTHTTVANPSQLGTVTAGLVTSSLNYAGTLETIQTTDKQSLNAVDAIVTVLRSDLDCPNASPTPGVPLTYMRGKPRPYQLPAVAPAKVVQPWPATGPCPLFGNS